MADLAVETPVVEPIYVISHGDLEVADVPPWALVADKFGLEQRVERLVACWRMLWLPVLRTSSF